MPLQILIADDDLDDLELLEEALLEYQPHTNIDKANGGMAAISYIDSYPESKLPNLIVLDYNMPDVNGLDVLTHIKALKQYDKVPKVIYSTSNANRYMTESLQNGATKYFVKPQNKTQLDEVAKQMLLLAAQG